jgi:hypothetical protein
MGQPAERPAGPMQRPGTVIREPMRPGRAVAPGTLEPLRPASVRPVPPRTIAHPLPTAEEHVRTVREPVDLDTVDEEADRMRLDMERRTAVREQRMATAAPSEADTAAIDARISHFQRMEVQAEQVARVQVDLADPRRLREAIIYHEILSPPKALREGPEMWDR